MKIVCLGDSLTAAYGSSAQIPDMAAAAPYNWVTLLNNSTADQYINSGVSGERIDQMLARFSTDVLAKSPDTCIILGGINDLFQRKTVAETIGNISAIVNLCKTNNITPIVGVPIPEWTFAWRFTEGFDAGNYSPTEYNFYLEQSGEMSALREAVRQYCLQNKVIFLNLYNTEFLTSPTTQDSTCYLSDKIHPNEKGYRIMAKHIASTIALIKHQVIRAAHIANLRTALTAELTRRGMSSQATYAADLTIGKPIKAVHVQELMDKLTNIKTAVYTDNPIILNRTTVKELHQTEISVMTDLLASYPKQGGITSCNTSCTGLCVSCTGSCTGGCTSCTGCSGCGASCSTNCNNDCYTGCHGSCKFWCNSCNATCTAACDSTCASSCAGNCNQNCSTGCTWQCAANCLTYCEAANLAINH
jgi:lysophospholipase L1-like esterase